MSPNAGCISGANIEREVAAIRHANLSVYEEVSGTGTSATHAHTYASAHTHLRRTASARPRAAEVRTSALSWAARQVAPTHVQAVLALRLCAQYRSTFDLHMRTAASEGTQRQAVYSGKIQSQRQRQR